jgi:hypothetical protein
LQHIGYEDNIRNKYEDEAISLARCKNLAIETAALRRDDILAIFDCVTKVSEGGDNTVEVNVLYDNKAKKIRLYQDGVWDDDMVMIGVKKLIISIKQIYLDSYEKYLIRKLKDVDLHFSKRGMVKELLHEYYKFIGSFNIDPFVKSKRNGDILYTAADESSHSIEEEFMKIYTKVSGDIIKSEMKQTHKDVLDIIKGNTKRSIDDLNNKVIGLIHMDEVFKNVMFGIKT